MDTLTPQPGNSGSKSSRSMGMLSNTSHIGSPQESRHQLVQHGAANAATTNITQDAHLKIDRRTGSSKNEIQHALEGGYIHIVINSHQRNVSCTAGVCRVLHDQFIAACNGKPTWSTKAFVCTVHKMGHHDVVSSEIFLCALPDEHPWEWANQS